MESAESIVPILLVLSGFRRIASLGRRAVILRNVNDTLSDFVGLTLYLACPSDAPLSFGASVQFCLFLFSLGLFKPFTP
jgi:hypothetical protein